MEWQRIHNFGHHNSIIFFFLSSPHPIFSSFMVRALHSIFQLAGNCALCLCTAARLRQYTIHIFHLKRHKHAVIQLYLSPSYWNIYIVFNSPLPMPMYMFDSSLLHFSICFVFFRPLSLILNFRCRISGSIFDFKRNGKWTFLYIENTVRKYSLFFK